MSIIAIEKRGEFWQAIIAANGKKYRALFSTKPSWQNVLDAWRLDLGNSDFVEVK